MRRQSPQTADACPFIEHGEPGCNSHFTLGKLRQAFGDCFGDYRQCSQFHKILTGSSHPVVSVTVHGRDLQPTGS